MNHLLTASPSTPSETKIVPYTPNPIPRFSFLTHPIYLDPSNPLVQRYLKQELTDSGTRYYQADNLLAQAVWFHIQDIAGKIVAASHSFLPGTTMGRMPTKLREGSCAELSLEEPRILRVAEGANPLVGRRTPSDWWKIWEDLQIIGREAMEWIGHATRRTRSLQGCSEWVWDSDDLTARLLRLRDMAAGTALTERPTYGSNGEAALTPYRPTEPLFDEEPAQPGVTVASLCRELILHPILSSGAANQLVPYRERTWDPRLVRPSPPTPANTPDSISVASREPPITGEDIFGGDSDDENP
ncbi:hypothetical protein C2E23DRAFT_859475 [Lenzites betulinus]|nr:hypothetical protein C2E23DRAFT_889140 [Lenzites betulinus]KAH9853211.1 hypothetical protein C2E23DRAFT_859475 [Lenzites betulinus]